ncbi:hypothetical protein CH251_02370 [Rhodococcus sp. 06-462-5]|uniref:DUF1707 SHOCT-like domain-containing protein n=1 Tax=unclassified Rhodococcus (in: high G+C Gram-positive bacteria) TaxID=192944 RepID=UPI000B9AA95D|nr:MULTISPECIES: DUF1707 domain-containing protein [unclassified Rhodococcus (in: high G+C Gram-positive bacteria)]OZC78620.1 hypothetical protein CH251_02370 [Rhodococcus sp. 06-462-5]OZE63674.1 hypothetical protein CH270_17120 [Rhodococcus sp. 02-925g]
MSELPEIRIGTADREKALDALSLHFSEGRLTVPEFDERSATIASATTRGELDTVFVDLPAASTPPHTPARPEQSPAPAETGGIDWRAVVMPLVIFGSLALFFLTDFDNKWLFFLLIPLAGALLSAGGHSKSPKKKKKER